MAAKYWIKLYHEILRDPKMGRLSDRVWRRVIELYLLAGESGETGDLPDTADLAWSLRADEDELAADLATLTGIDILRKTETGWFLIHFADRQAASTSTERMRRYRDRQQREQYDAKPETETQRLCDDDVTIRNVEPDTDTDTDTDTESDTDTDAPRGSGDATPKTVVYPQFPAPKPWTQVLARAGIMVNGAYESEMWGDLADEAGDVRFESAVKAACAQGVRTLAYVKGVIDRSTKEGRMPGDPRPDTRASPSIGHDINAAIRDFAQEDT